MSASPPPPPPPSPDNQNLDGPRPLEIIAHVSFYTKSQSSTAKGKKGKTSTTKDMRAKEFTYLFAADEHNYLKFLQVILNSHHLVKYVAKHVADQVVFPCKVQVPPAMYVTILSPLFVALNICYSSKANATYIVNFNEFKALATKINKKTISWAIIVTVEMTDIEKAFSKVSTAKLCPC